MFSVDIFVQGVGKTLYWEVSNGSTEGGGLSEGHDLQKKSGLCIIPVNQKLFITCTSCPRTQAITMTSAFHLFPCRTLQLWAWPHCSTLVLVGDECSLTGWVFYCCVLLLLPIIQTWCCCGERHSIDSAFNILNLPPHKWFSGAGIIKGMRRI